MKKVFAIVLFALTMCQMSYAHAESATTYRETQRECGASWTCRLLQLMSFGGGVVTFPLALGSRIAESSMLKALDNTLLATDYQKLKNEDFRTVLWALSLLSTTATVIWTALGIYYCP